MNNNGYAPFATILNNLIADPKLKAAFDSVIVSMPYSDQATITQAMFMPSVTSGNGHNSTIQTRWNMAELTMTDFPDPVWIIPGLIPAGLTFLAGRPKVGKSWLALQIAYAKSTGSIFFDKTVTPGRVVYYSYEDTPRRLKDRTQKQGIPSSASIQFDTEGTKLSEGGIAKLELDIQSGVSLIIIDTLARALGKVDHDDLAEMTESIGNLQKLAIDANIGLIVIDHHRKSNGFDNDPIDDIIGSTGKSSPTDASIGIYRSQGRKETTLKAVGRDFEDVELALAWDAQQCIWQCLGKADDVREDTKAYDVLIAIETIKKSGDIATTRRIAAMADMKESNVSFILGDLIMKGKVIRLPKQGKEQPYELL